MRKTSFMGLWIKALHVNPNKVLHAQISVKNSFKQHEVSVKSWTDISKTSSFRVYNIVKDDKQ